MTWNLTLLHLYTMRVGGFKYFVQPISDDGCWTKWLNHHFSAPSVDQPRSPKSCQVHWGALSIVAINAMMGSITWAITVFQNERSCLVLSWSTWWNHHWMRDLKNLSQTLGAVWVYKLQGGYLFFKKVTRGFFAQVKRSEPNFWGFLRESSSGYYTNFSYFLSKTLFEFPATWIG